MYFNTELGWSVGLTDTSFERVGRDGLQPGLAPQAQLPDRSSPNSTRWAPSFSDRVRKNLSFAVSWLITDRWGEKLKTCTSQVYSEGSNLHQGKAR